MRTPSTSGRRAATALVTALAVLSPLTPAVAAGQASVPSTTAVTAKKSKPAKSPVVWAHRGASKDAPEETMAAYQRALADGADVLEGDIAQTKDGHLVVIHDDTLTRTTNVEELFPDRAPWNVRDFTLAEIKTLDAGSWWDPSFAGQKVPTMREWFAFNRGRAGLAPEIKNPNLYPGIVQNVAKELRHWGYTKPRKARNGAPLIFVQSFSEPALRELDSLLPRVPLFALASGYTYMTSDDARLRELATWADAIAGNPVVNNASQVARAKSFGLTVIGEVEDSPVLDRMVIDQGYDVLFTNTPDVARAVIAGRRPFTPRGPVSIDSIVYNPEGDDVAKDGGEYVILRNNTSELVDISGYTLREFGNVLLRVGDKAVIEPGGLYRVYVGPGTDAADRHFNGRTAGVLNDKVTDHVYLYDADRVMKDIYSYIAS